MSYTKGECKHTLIFNYVNGESQCGECGMKFIKTKQGQRLNIEALEDMYEACQHTLIWLSALIASQEHLESGRTLAEVINKALAKAEGKGEEK